MIPEPSIRLSQWLVQEPEEEEETQSQDKEEDRVELLSESEALELIQRLTPRTLARLHIP